MATEFKIRTKETKGFATLIVRFQMRHAGVDYRMVSGLEVDIQAWNKSRKSAQALTKFRDNNPVLTKKMDLIKQNLDMLVNQNNPPSKEEVRSVIDNIVYAEARAANEQRKEKKARAEEESKRTTLNKYIAMYTKQIETGARQTERGRNFAASTVKTVKLALDQFAQFQKAVKRTYDFNDINMDFYYAYTAYLKKKQYSINTVGKCIKELKTVMAAAESEGHHHNNLWKDKKFKGTRVEVDNIYLTQDDLDKLMAVPEDKLDYYQLLARDIFMVGVYTAQRVSDYNNIKKEDFTTVTKKSIVEVPDPENPWVMRDEIVQKEVLYVNIRQQKTGAKVTIPCKTELKKIMERYDYQLPHLADQVINRNIKKVAEMAGLTELIEIETTKGGTPKKEKIEKYKLVHTHTARRTGATLMYLAGIDIYDIMKVTGHSSPKMLKKYIKADSLEVAEKLSDKYDYFN